MLTYWIKVITIFKIIHCDDKTLIQGKLRDLTSKLCLTYFRDLQNNGIEFIAAGVFRKLTGLVQL